MSDLKKYYIVGVVSYVFLIILRIFIMRSSQFMPQSILYLLGFAFIYYAVAVGLSYVISKVQNRTIRILLFYVIIAIIILQNVRTIFYILAVFFGAHLFVDTTIPTLVLPYFFIIESIHFDIFRKPEFSKPEPQIEEEKEEFDADEFFRN